MSDSLFRRTWKWIAVVLTSTLLMTLLAGIAPRTARADGQNVLEYMFYHARPDNPSPSNIRVLGDLTVSPTITWDYWMGAIMDARELGKSRSFEIDVPESGYYQVALQGYGEDRVGIWDLAIDSVNVGRHDFYGESFGLYPVHTYRTIELTGGTHVLTFTSVGKNPAAIDGGSNHSAYPHKLILTQKTALPHLEVKTNSVQSSLAVGSQWQVEPYVQWSDGSVLNEIEPITYTYSSQTPEVASVTAGGTVSAISSGTAQITVAAQWHGVTAEQTYMLTVYREVIQSYMFYDARPDNPSSSNIRVLGDLTVSPTITWDYWMGAIMDARELGKSRSFEIDVPESGYYQVALQGYGEDRVGIWDLGIDGVNVGRHDFYGESFGLYPVHTYRTIALTGGTHVLTFTSVGKNPAAIDGGSNHSAYPHKLILTEKTQLPDLQVHTTTERTSLLPGEQWQIQPYVQWSDGVVLDDIEPVIYSYTSSNSNIASVNANGKVTAVNPGTVQINVTAQWHDVTVVQSYAIVVTTESKLEYMFYNARPGNTSSNIRVLGDLSVSPTITWDAAIGAIMDAREIGKSRSFEIDVEEPGFYQVTLQGYGEDRVGIWDLVIDGVNVGRHDFYAPTFGMTPPRNYRTIELTRGQHELTFISIGKNPAAIDGGSNHSAYPHKLTLTRKNEPSELEVQIDPIHARLLLQEQWQIHSSVQWSDGAAIHETEPVTYTYASDDPQVATVNAQGLVSATHPGTTRMTVSASLYGETATRSFDLEVVDLALQSVSIVMDRASLILNKTATLQVKGTLTDNTQANLSNAVITYTSDNPSIVSVDPQGVVSGLQLGSATIQAVVTLAGQTLSASYPLTVKEPTLSSLELTFDSHTIVESQYVKAIVNGYDQNEDSLDLADATITYSSTNEQIIKYTEDGFFKAIATGTTTLSVNVNWRGVTQVLEQDVTVNALVSDKTRSTYYTDAKVSNARNNANQYNWASNARSAAVNSAEAVLDKGLDYLWQLVPPPTLPSSYGVNEPLGSPITGKSVDAFGNYPYRGDPYLEPWKIIDPSAVDENGEFYRYPTNDFAAYYSSGLDEHGVFQPTLADRSLLVNELYPEKGPTWGVDDGFGWVDENGNTYAFIAYYIHWFLWFSGDIQDNLIALRDAYLLSGDERFAQAGIILLDRIADIYPSLSQRQFDRTVFLKSGRYGKAVGSIWEVGLALDFASAYDAFFPAMDDPLVMDGVLDYLQEKAEIYKLSYKDSATGIRKNIEDGILREIYKAVRNADLEGNFGFHQSALILAAVVLDTLPETQQWIDFTFQSGKFDSSLDQITGGNLLPALVSAIDRDGQGDEGSPHYNSEWLKPYSFLRIADTLYGYDKYPEADLYQSVKLKKMFSAMYQLMLAERYTPTIGDTANTGNPVLYFNKTEMAKAFEVYGDPIYAQLLYFLNQNRTNGLRSDIFTADPESLATEVEVVIDAYGPLNLGSTQLTGFGFTGLRDGVRDNPTFGKSYLFPDLTVVQNSTAYTPYPQSSTVQFEANTPGQSITFAFRVDNSGSYEIYLRPFRAPSYGIYSVYVDGQFLKEVDFFGSSKELEQIGELSLSEGTHQIRFVNTGIHPESSNYKMGVTELTIREAQDGEAEPEVDTLRDFWMYYGVNDRHGHRDTLNLGLHAFGLDLAPDLGYPEYSNDTDAHRAEWVVNTVSHNTVVVDKQKQNPQEGATPLHYDDDGVVKLIDVEAPIVYPQTTDYRRTTAMIRVDEENSYAVDFFKVAGGDDHLFSFHAAEGTASVEGLNLVTQETGTYAGPNVEFGQRTDDVPGYYYKGHGYQWLKDVRKDVTPASQFSVDWQVKDTWDVLGKGAKALTDVHLRLTMMGPLSDVALATGVPPRNKPGNPQELTYLLAHRSGNNLDSLFTSVVEPYRSERYIESIAPAVVKKNGIVVDSNEAKAVRVALVNGRVDYIVYSARPNILYTIDDKIQFKGFFGVYSEKDGKGLYNYINDGAFIAPIDAAPSTSLARLEGVVTDFTKGLTTNNFIQVQMDLHGKPLQELVGEWLYIENDGIRNAVYQIKGIESLGGNHYRISIGDYTTVRSYLDVTDLSKGYLYDFAAGNAFTIPLAYSSSKLAAIAAAADKLELTGNESVPVQVSGYWLGGLPADLSEAVVSYTSNDVNVATVAPDGVVSAIGPGTATIKVQVTLDGVTLESQLQFQVVIPLTGTAKPVQPVLSDNNGHDTGLLDGDYTVTMNLWYGQNGNIYRLYENDVLIDTRILSDNTPSSQSVSTILTGRQNGTYRYYAELTNAMGTTRGAVHVVNVTHAAPGKPVLSSNNWDGDGNYTVAMNMWWGMNGTTYNLYENGILIHTQAMEKHTPNAQSASVNITGRSVGTYEYRAELVNDAGAVMSDAHVIQVTRS